MNNQNRQQHLQQTNLADSVPQRPEYPPTLQEISTQIMALHQQSLVNHLQILELLNKLKGDKNNG